MSAALLVGCGGDGDDGGSSGAASTGMAASEPTTSQPTSEAGPGSEPGSAADPGTDGPGTGAPDTSAGPSSDPGTSTDPDPSAGPGTGDPDTSTGPDTADPDTSGDTPGDPSGDPSGDPTGDACEAEMHAGQATYYDADGSGNCSFDAAPGDPLVAAMNTADYAASAACGACVAVDGPDGSTTVRIVDRCPGCPQGNIDLHPDAFAMLADPQLGIVPITWRYVSCPGDGNIVYHFKEGSNQWWTAVQIRDHRNAIATFEYKDMMGNWKLVERVDYNFFIDMAGMGPGPYSFRVTDVLGNVLEDSGVPFVEAGDSPGSGQFPACVP